MSETVIYTIPDCPYCAAAKRDLGERGVRYREIDVESNAEARKEMLVLSGDTLVPVIVEGGKVTKGFGGG